MSNIKNIFYGIFLYLIVYRLSRTKYYKTAGAILVTGQASLVFNTIIEDSRPECILSALEYLTFTPFICSLLFSSRMIPVASGFCLLGMMICGLFTPSSSFGYIVISAICFVTFSILVWLAAILRDRTEAALILNKKLLEKSENELKSKANDLSKAHKLARLGMWRLSFSRGEVYLSPEASEIFDLEAKSTVMSRENFISMVLPADRETISNIKENITNRTQIDPYVVEYGFLTHKSVEKHCVSLVNLEINFEGAPVAVSGIVQDITERWQTEKLRSEKEAAERANQAQSMFLANISHEIRTPLHGILSFAKLGIQRSGKSSIEKMNSYFQEILDSGSKLMFILNDLLDLAKLESGRVDYKMVETDLVELTRHTVSEVGALAAEKELRFSIDSSEAKVICAVDQGRMAQVFRNLISNSIKYSHPNTCVSIFIRRHESFFVFWEIVSHGVGIPQHELESIFDKFVQSSRTRTGAGGTGLGLSISKEIVTYHHGKIWAASHLSGETHFFVQLPQSSAIPFHGAPSMS